MGFNLEIAHQQGDAATSSAGGTQKHGRKPLPAPITPAQLASWFPLGFCGYRKVDDGLHGAIPVLYMNVGSFNVERVHKSGCTKQEIMNICCKELRRVGCRKMILVADFAGIPLSVLKSTFWAELVPELALMLNTGFPELIHELVVLRAGHIGRIAAQRVAAQLQCPRKVFVPGDEVEAQNALLKIGLGCAVEALFTLPVQSQTTGRRTVTTFSVLAKIVSILLAAAATAYAVRAAAQALCVHWAMAAEPGVCLAVLPTISAVGFSVLILWWSPHSWLAKKSASASPASVQDEKWWPDIHTGSCGEPCFSRPTLGHVLTTCPEGQLLQGDAQVLSQHCMRIVEACRTVAEGASGKVGTLTIKCVQRTPSRSTWWGKEAACPIMFNCVDMLLDTKAPIQAVLWSLYSVEERIKWDRFLSAVEILRAASPQTTSGALGDIIYCRMPLFCGMAPRDFVLERFLVQMPDDGFAIVMQSCPASSAASFGKPAGAEGFVRARTILSAYLVMPGAQGQLRVTAISQTDFGGVIFTRAQSCLLSLIRQQQRQWVQHLENHCNRNLQEEETIHWSHMIALSVLGFTAVHELYAAVALLMGALILPCLLLRTHPAEKDIAIPSVPDKSTWWPALEHGPHGEPRFRVCASVPPKMLDPQYEFEHDAGQLLGNLQDTINLFKSVGRKQKKQIGNLKIEHVMQWPSGSVWASIQGNSGAGMIVLSVQLLRPTPLEAVLWSFHSPQDRMTWDEGAFCEFDVLCPAVVQPSSNALGDVIYCRSSPKPAQDRDLVQERFLVHLPEGGYAIVIKSCSEEAASQLGKAPQKNVVRATTILSGYIVTPRDGGGLVIDHLSHTKFGGTVPDWVQRLLIKVRKKSMMSLGARLEAHIHRDQYPQGSAHAMAKSGNFSWDSCSCFTGPSLHRDSSGGARRGSGKWKRTA